MVFRYYLQYDQYKQPFPVVSQTSSFLFRLRYKTKRVPNYTISEQEEDLTPGFDMRLNDAHKIPTQGTVK